MSALTMTGSAQPANVREASRDDNAAAYMLLPREAWEAVMTKLEQLSRIDHHTRKLANEIDELLTPHAPYSWLHVEHTVR